MKFRTIVIPSGNATAIEVPDDRVGYRGRRPAPITAAEPGACGQAHTPDAGTDLGRDIGLAVAIEIPDLGVC